MVKIRSNFDISKVTFATTVPIHATVVADNVRMELLYVLSCRSLVILSALYSIRAPYSIVAHCKDHVTNGTSKIFEFSCLKYPIFDLILTQFGP